MALSQREVTYERRSSIQSRVKRNERRITELEVELQALKAAPEPRDYNAPFDAPDECAAGTCSYHDLYLATGPAEMSHAAYHDLERQAKEHFEQCISLPGERCPIYSDFETRLRA